MAISIRPLMAVGVLVSATFPTIVAGAALAPAEAVGGCDRNYDDSISLLSSNGEYWYPDTRHHIYDCNSVYVRADRVNGTDICAQYRIRYWSSSGSVGTTAWRQVCEGNTREIASNFLQGTEYRVESNKASAVRVWD